MDLEKEIADTFKIYLANRYQVLQQLYADENIQLEEKWKQTKKMWTETCKETVDRLKERQYKKAILNTCGTRAGKEETQHQYTRAHKEVRRS